MKKLLLAAVAAVGLGGTAHAELDPYIGEIMIFAGNFCPVNWAPTNGQLLSISQNTALFSLLGTTYGGDGVTTFALPNNEPILTRTRAPLTQCIALYGVYPSRP